MASLHQGQIDNSKIFQNNHMYYLIIGGWEGLRGNKLSLGKGGGGGGLPKWSKKDFVINVK